jgi:hypothetical protein
MRLALLFVIAGIASGCVVQDSHGDLSVINSSDVAIEELYVTDIGSPTWGANLLGGVPLLPDETITLDVRCGTYDSLLVDQSGSHCQLSSIRLCGDDATWVITNDTCNVF